MEGTAPGQALLVAGPTDGEGDGKARAALGPLADALRAGGRPWTIRRLGGDGDAAIDPGAIRRAVDALAGAETDVAWCVVLGAIADDGSGSRLQLSDHGASGDDASWPLASLAGIGARAGAAVRIAIVDGEPPADVAGMLAALGDDGLRMVIAVDDGGQAAVELLVAALRGGALDPRCGAITARSLAAFVAAARPLAAIALPAGDGVDAELFEPPSLERLWRLGWSVATVGRVGAAPNAADGTDDAVIGTVLPGRFRLDARIAEGKFGIVYRARQLTIGRDVAVKVMRAGVDPFSEDGRLFVQEIQAVGRIDHRNVVRVYQADVTGDGRLFFAMELLEGRELQAQVAQGPIPVAAAVALVRQLLAGLDAAHRAGLVHADVKPGNVVVVGDGDDARVVLVDFGLARLRRPDEAAPSVGGTPAYMAPEQLRDGRVDARSDLFSTGLVLVALITGWRRQRRRELTPPAEVLAAIPDEAVRGVLARALAIEPAERFPTAAAFAAALDGDAGTDAAPPERPPFHGLAAFDERDHGLLFGRERELLQLSELALHRRLVVVTAPSGVGKTSLLRAGLRPRLEALSTTVVYASCRTDDEAGLAGALVPAALVPAALLPAATSLLAAMTARSPAGAVILLDQVETALETAEPTTAQTLLDAALAAATHRDVHGCVVLSVREDFLARLLDRAGGRLEGAPIVRIGPLAPDGARDAILRPLAERRLTIAPDLLDRLLADLVAAGRQLGAELGWGSLTPIYPPHLQLACTVLYERLPDGDATLTLAHYQSLGGFDAIVGEHLDRVLDGLDAADGAVARDLFVALVTAAHGRSARTEGELADALGGDPAPLAAVLEHLRRQGLVVRVRRPDGDVVWELIHDSLVPRVLAWIDRRDLARRRAIELVRYHLRRSRPGAPSLLSRPELRELADHTDVVTSLDADWRRAARPTESERAWTPAALVTRSRQVQRRITLAAIALVATVIAGIGFAAFERWRSARDRAAEAVRRDRDLGLVAFEFAPFDWDPDRLAVIDVSIEALPSLSWSLHAVSVDPLTDVENLGEPFTSGRFGLLSSVQQASGTRLDNAEAAGGPAFLVITGRSRAGEPDCGPSVIPIRSLPGYAKRKDGPRMHRILVPTCQVTHSNMIEIPSGQFHYGGVGDPPSAIMAAVAEYRAAVAMNLHGFRIDRTEVTNSAFAAFATMWQLSGERPPSYLDSDELRHSDDATSPVAGVSWNTSMRYCAYLGRRLPSKFEWGRAIRGPASMNGRPNHRNFPWDGEWRVGAARVDAGGERGVAPVATHTLDKSPEGIFDLAGNVQEWTASIPSNGDQNYRVTRGAGWDTPERDRDGALVDYVAIENPRRLGIETFDLGFRCAADAMPR